MHYKMLFDIILDARSKYLQTNSDHGFLPRYNFYVLNNLEHPVCNIFEFKNRQNPSGLVTRGIDYMIL